MTSTTSSAKRLGLGACALAALTMVVATASPAAADPVGAGEASAYGATVSLAGQEAVPPTPTATVTMPPGGEASETLVDVPADPVLISGTLNADAVVHRDADVESSLAVVTQEVPGPYNAAAVGLIEGAEVLVDGVAADVSLLTADVIRAEAVAVCRDGAVSYSAASEIINLNVGGEDVPLNAPITDILDGLQDVLDQTGLNAVADIQQNVVVPTDDGIAVTALVVTVLAAAGDAPLAEVRLGHAEVNGLACGDLPECSDTIDNDGDGVADIDDPGCHTDGDANNPDSYDPEDDSELDAAPAAPTAAPAAPAAQLPATGGDAASTAGLAAVMAGGALAIVALRRRLV